MSKGLYHCSRCKAHFYDAEATEMHIRDKHKGEGSVLRHPTKRELIIRDEQQRNAIEALQARVDRLEEALEMTLATLSAERTRSGGQPFAGTWTFPNLRRRCTVLEVEEIARTALNDTDGETGS